MIHAGRTWRFWCSGDLAIGICDPAIRRSRDLIWPDREIDTARHRHDRQISKSPGRQIMHNLNHLDVDNELASPRGGLYAQR
jgi:hypothetical protein